ncbi:MAG TPA: hypothetical protein VEF06_10245, partial [Bryobacteraceae bacterium]|nr:hypothetical protein [Bryobacteraceae bacterium]
MPIENAYQPLLPALTGFLSAAASLPIGRAFHILIALAYCAGPVTLYWLVWEWSDSLAASFIAGLVYSLISPAAMFFPPVREISGSARAPQRLFNIVYYGEGPHGLA